MSDMKANSLVAVIGDEDTVSGFLLAGIGGIDRQNRKNFKIVNQDTPVGDLEETFKEFTVDRKDIAIILIDQKIANDIRHVIDNHREAIPTILEIPSKDEVYDPSKDSILRRAQAMIGGEDR